MRLGSHCEAHETVRSEPSALSSVQRLPTMPVTRGGAPAPSAECPGPVSVFMCR